MGRSGRALLEIRRNTSNHCRHFYQNIPVTFTSVASKASFIFCEHTSTIDVSGLLVAKARTKDRGIPRAPGDVNAFAATESSVIVTNSKRRDEILAMGGAGYQGGNKSTTKVILLKL